MLKPLFILTVFLLASLPPVFAQDPQITGQIYADNWFQFWVNGKLIATDPVDFTPHNVVEVQFSAAYPITYAILAQDFADPQTGLEYNQTRIGDGGLMAAFSDGTVTNGNWHCEAVFTAPLDPACLNNNPAATCQASYQETPNDWFAADFDASAWAEAEVFEASEVRPLGDFADYEWGEAVFIWSADLRLDNTVLCRITVNSAEEASASFLVENSVNPVIENSHPEPANLDGERPPRNGRGEGPRPPRPPRP